MNFFQQLLTSTIGIFKTSTPKKVIPDQCSNTLHGQLKIERKIEPTIIKASTKVNGQLVADNAIFEGKMEINGQAKCQDCEFKEEILIRGSAVLQNCTFAKPLEMLTKKAHFSRCSAKEVFITNPIPATAFYPQKVYLKESSIDQIVFSHPGGIVYCSKNSHVSTVVNGKIIRK